MYGVMKTEVILTFVNELWDLAAARGKEDIISSINKPGLYSKSVNTVCFCL